MFLAARLRAEGDDGRSVDALTAAAIGLGAWPAFTAGNLLISAVRGQYVLSGILMSVLVLFAAAGWLFAAARADRPRMGRTVALGLVGLWVLGGVMRVLPGGLPGDHLWGAFGSIRIMGVLVLAYAVLHSQLLGVDVKLRWTISKSTLAAAFIAVFFLASEGAQILFGQENEVVGLLAAGLLVFALAPLQRAADRLAERAVPLATPHPTAGPSSSGADREEAYRRALRLALRDRAVTREEDVHLHEVAEHMGIGAGRAMALRVEVERELSPKPFPEGDG